MSHQRSPLKARNINLNENSIRRPVGKKQLKRRSSLFGLSENKEPPKKRLFVDIYDDSLDGSFADSCSQNDSLYSLSKKSTSPVKKYVTALPMDLRLATKIRIISGRPFPFSDTSSNDNSSTRLTFNSSIIDESCKLLTQADLTNMHLPGIKKAHPLSILKAAGLYYQYPDISFMQMFPRLDGISRSKGIRTSLLSIGNEVVDSIQAEWAESFDHLYNSWKNGKRNSFYLCGPQFTILFIKNWKPADSVFGFEEEETCMGLNDFWEHRVIITPTSFGFRKSLEANGIPFKLPLQCGEEREHENWLRGIGFSPSKIKVPTTDSQDQLLQEESSRNSVVNSAAESTIAIVQLEAIDAFRKLMLKLNLGWAKTGQQAMLPPTMLSTDPFLNSALKSLNFKAQVLKKQEGTQYTLDLDDGPILPHVSHLLHEFFRSCNNQLDGNTLKVHVNGRSICDGFNEATAAMHTNLNEFAFDGCKLRYFY